MDDVSCKHNDPEAEEETLIKVLGLNRHDLVALTGLAHLYVSCIRKEEARDRNREFFQNLWFRKSEVSIRPKCVGPAMTLQSELLKLRLRHNQIRCRINFPNAQNL